jgi:hypothetical protein
VQQATNVLSELLRVVPSHRPLPESDAIKPASPQVLARTVAAYARGLAAGIRAASPQMMEALTSEITNKLCDGPVLEAQNMLLGRLAQSLPEVLTSDALDCPDHAHQENAVVEGLIPDYRRAA